VSEQKKPTAWQQALRIFEAHQRRIVALESKVNASATRAIVGYTVDANGALVVTLIDGREEVVGIVRNA